MSTLENMQALNNSSIIHEEKTKEITIVDH